MRMSLYVSQIKAFKSAEPKTLGVSFTTARYPIIISIIAAVLSLSLQMFDQIQPCWMLLSRLFAYCWNAAYEILVIQSEISLEVNI